MDIRTAFGQVLRETRTQKGISQEQLALEADIDRSYISKLEQGQYQPSLEKIIALAKILECSPGKLVDTTAEKLSR
ncbi:MAG: helix-turn-helix domain-containing protein [Cellvibrionaceae bacterium]